MNKKEFRVGVPCSTQLFPTCSTSELAVSRLLAQHREGGRCPSRSGDLDLRLTQRHWLGDEARGLRSCGVDSRDTWVPWEGSWCWWEQGELGVQQPGSFAKEAVW